MTGWVLSFAAGVLALQWQPALPDARAAWLLPGLVLALVAAGGLRVAGLTRLASLPRPAHEPPSPSAPWRVAGRLLALLLCAAIGFLWAAHRAHGRMESRLDPMLEGRDLEVVGVVASLPSVGERSVRFEFEPESAEVALPPRLQLAWYRAAQWSEESPAVLEAAAQVRAGERWRLTLRLRRPHGGINPHGFDYEAWLLERGIGATGYVRARPAPERLGVRREPADFIERAREAVRDRFRDALGDSPTAGLLIALAVGDQRAIPAPQWQVFNRTGVTHLVSISGLHVTLVSGLAAGLVGWGWRRSARLCLALPARKPAALAAIVAALGYALLAGFAVPAQRTFLMVTVVALALWAGRVTSPARVLVLALGAVLAVDPWAVLAAGFWLSFGAVALIFFAVAGGSSAAPRARQWWDTQWAVTIGMAPAGLFLFSQVSLIGPVANAVAIPLVSAVITPLVLVAAAIPLDVPLAARAVAELPLGLADGLTRALLVFLEWCAALPSAVWRQHAPPLWAVLAAVAGTLWLLLPRGFPSRWAGLALMAPAFALPPPAPAEGEAWVSTLDVGQGLAVVVRTATRALVYDAGPAFGPETDAGERIVVPFLHASGIAYVDRFVATHQDIDHIGGARSLLAAVAVGEVRSSLARGHALLGVAPFAQPCRAGERWRWDGVTFEFVFPDADEAAAARKANDASCVLKVSAGGRAMLLTGDIERAAEERLVARDPAALRADVLLAPHHGSRTSSTPGFLAAVGARRVVIPVGYRSRFGHPHPAVLARYAAAGMDVHRTDLEGAVTVRLGPSLAVESERAARARYWLPKPAPRAGRAAS